MKLYLFFSKANSKTLKLIVKSNCVKLLTKNVHASSLNSINLYVFQSIDGTKIRKIKHIKKEISIILTPEVSLISKLDIFLLYFFINKQK